MEQIVKYGSAELDNIQKLLRIPGDHLHTHEVLLRDRDVHLGNVTFPDGAMIEMKIVIPYSRDYPYIQAQFYTADRVPMDMEIRGEWLGTWEFSDRKQQYKVQITAADDDL